MKKFIVERKLPGAGNMTARELKDISKTTVEVISALGKPYSWVQSFVTDDKIGLKGSYFFEVQILRAPDLYF